ncbi:hypothetical protein D9M71_546260 [compost metagenome]
MLEHLDHIGAPFAAAVARVHRVDRDVSTGVGGEPVVGEYRVGGVVLAEVVEQVHAHALGFEPAGGLGNFIARHLGQGLCGDVGAAALERVVGCGFRVGGESMWPDHDHCRRCLNRTRWKCHVEIPGWEQG